MKIVVNTYHFNVRNGLFVTTIRSLRKKNGAIHPKKEGVHTITGFVLDFDKKVFHLYENIFIDKTLFVKIFVYDNLNTR